MVKKIIILYLLIFFLSCTGKSDNDSTIEIEISDQIIQSTFDDDTSEILEVINFGITPWQDDEQMMLAYEPLLEYLTEKTGKKFILNIMPDYGVLKDYLKSGRIQIACFSPGAYSDALIEIPESMKYIATTSKRVGDENRDFYYGFIITTKENNINTIEDLKGKTFGFVDLKSSSGYIYPMGLFLSKNIDPDTFFSDIFFLGSHDRLTDAVASGNIDAGATWEGSFEQAIKRNGDIYKIILMTERIPYDAIAAHIEISDSFVKELQTILINLPIDAKTSDGVRVFGGEYFPYTGFVLRDKEFYNIIIETLTLLDNYHKDD